MNVEIGKRGHAVSILGIFVWNFWYSAFAVYDAGWLFLLEVAIVKVPL